MLDRLNLSEAQERILISFVRSRMPSVVTWLAGCGFTSVATDFDLQTCLATAIPVVLWPALYYAVSRGLEEQGYTLGRFSPLGVNAPPTYHRSAPDSFGVRSRSATPEGVAERDKSVRARSAGRDISTQGGGGLVAGEALPPPPLNPRASGEAPPSALVAERATIGTPDRVAPDWPTVSQVQGTLREFGWPIEVDGVEGPQTQAAVRAFQRGWTGEDLAVDGRAGPMTWAAMGLSGGQASPHFAFREFREGLGSPGSGWIEVNRDLVRGLEAYRARFGGPVVVRSGFRGPQYNAAVGGATASRHLTGDACDFEPRPGGSLAAVRSLGVFGGLGVISSNGLVTHADVRPKDPAQPTVWYYG